MSPEERQLLTALFDRVRTASATPRDRDAETLIEQQVREQPYSTYYLAQAVIVQEKGLEAASNRIKELEERIHQLETSVEHQPQAPQGGGFLSSIFGSSQAPAQRPAPASAPVGGPWGSAPQQGYQNQGYARGYDDGYRGGPAPSGPAPTGPWGAAPQAPAAGGSFLRGALGTAAGVAGGMLLAHTLSSAFSNHTSALGLGSPFNEASNPFGTPEAPVQETIINNNYFGDDAVREASADNQSGFGGNDNGWQQADYSNDVQSDFGSSFDNDDNLNV